MARIVRATDPTAIDQAVAALERGELVGIPTETVYGIAAMPTAEAVARLIQAKHRSAEKGIQLLVDSLEQAQALAVFYPAARHLAEVFWPGGLTLVVGRRLDMELPDALGGGRNTLGIRLPDHVVPRSLARRLGPIAASSANLSGEPDAAAAEIVERTLGEELALVIDDGPVRGGVPSTVVDCTLLEVQPRVLREGAISAADITAALAPD